MGLPSTLVEECDGGKTLRVHHVVFVCKISWCQKSVSYGCLPFRKLMFSRYRHALRKVNEAAKGKMTPSEIWKALACTLVCETLEGQDREPRPALYTAAQCYWACIRASPEMTWRMALTSLTADQPDAKLREGNRYATGLLGGWANRRFFVTEDGGLGMGPKVMQADDLVATVAGMRTPVVLRPSGAGFKFIGEAYVHGIMDGEAPSGPLQDIDVV